MGNLAQYPTPSSRGSKASSTGCISALLLSTGIMCCVCVVMTKEEMVKQCKLACSLCTLYLHEYTTIDSECHMGHGMVLYNTQANMSLLRIHMGVCIDISCHMYAITNVTYIFCPLIHVAFTPPLLVDIQSG